MRNPISEDLRIKEFLFIFFSLAPHLLKTFFFFEFLLRASFKCFKQLNEVQLNTVGLNHKIQI